MFEEVDLQIQIRSFFPVSAWTMTFVKYSYLLINGNDIFYYLKKMENDYRRVNSSENRDIMLNHAKIGRYIVSIATIWQYTGCVSYVIMGSRRTSFVQGNETVFVRHLPFPIYSKLINFTVSPNYEILLAGQALACFLLVSVMANTNNLAVLLVVHVSGQVMILKRFLKSLVSNKKAEKKTNGEWQRNNKTVKSKIAVIVKQHVRVIKLMENIEKIMHQICLAEFVGSVFMFCLQGYLIIKDWEQKDYKNLLPDFILLGTITFNIFVLCFTGEFLIQKCKEIGETAYMIEWYRLPGKGSLDLILVIVMSNCCITITAGKFVKLSLPSFSYVIQSALVYLNMLLTLTTYSNMHEGRKVTVNPFYQSDFNYSTELNRWLFKLIGVWPRSLDDLRIFKILQNVLICFEYILFVYLLASNILYLMFEEIDLQIQIRSFFPLSAWTMTFVKYSYLLINGNDIFYYLKRMENDYRRVNSSENRDIMLNHAKIGRYIVSIVTIWLYMGCVFYVIVGSRRTSFVQGNETVFVKHLPFPIYSKLINLTVSPNYELLLAGQTLACFSVVSIIANTNNLAVLLVVHVCGQVMILKRFLKSLVSNKKAEKKTNGEWQRNNKTVKSKIAVIVKQHVRVIKFIENIENILNQMCLVEFLGSVIMFCLQGFLIIKEWEQKNYTNLLTDLMLLVTITFNIFVLCFIGELVIQKCKEVGETAYMIEWYRLPGKANLDLILIILMSNYNINITAGKFVKLSLPSFSYVIQSALVYLNMLLTFTTH
ncbi:uncharacterized protein [Prorops nasuta]|uniref:uncharacterized protein n=1 Tax=Prorops nasuta TaxID=863751 RepID=UPI0034CF222B